MSPSLLALVLFAAWTMLLVLLIPAFRLPLILSGKRAANSFRPTAEGDSLLAQRLARAHANCYEGLPIFAVLVLAAQSSGHQTVTDPLALWVIAARVAQSITHLVSTADPAITIRFGFFLVQYGIMTVWAIELIRIGLA